MKRKPIHTAIAIAAWAVVLAGFRTNDLTTAKLRPQLSVLEGLPLSGCGTGTTSTWSTTSYGYSLKMSRARAKELVEPELRKQGFIRANDDDIGGIVYRKSLNVPGGVMVCLRDSWGGGESNLFMAVYYPKLTWYGMRVPSP